MEPPSGQEGSSVSCNKHTLVGLFFVVFLILTCSVFWPAMHPASAADAQAHATPVVYLPGIYRMPTPTPTPTPTSMPATGATYAEIPVEYYVPPDRPDSQHPDLNLDLRGYEPTSAWQGLVDYSGDTDENPVNLAALFNPWRLPQFKETYRVYDWNWAQNVKGSLLTVPPVTLIKMSAELGELIYLPYRAAEMYQGGFRAMVLYATDNQITLNYTRKGSVATGFTVHITNIGVDPNLVALYQRCNQEGRHTLPGITNGQPIGRAKAGGILVAVRDTGSFMDPRSRKDWWSGF